MCPPSAAIAAAHLFIIFLYSSPEMRSFPPFLFSILPHVYYEELYLFSEAFFPKISSGWCVQFAQTFAHCLYSVFLSQHNKLFIRFQLLCLLCDCLWIAMMLVGVRVEDADDGGSAEGWPSLMTPEGESWNKKNFSTHRNPALCTQCLRSWVKIRTLFCDHWLMELHIWTSEICWKLL